MKRVGMLTSGGDCQALNAAMRGVAKSLLYSGEQVEIYGFMDGYKVSSMETSSFLQEVNFPGSLRAGERFSAAQGYHSRQ